MSLLTPEELERFLPAESTQAAGTRRCAASRRRSRQIEALRRLEIPEDMRNRYGVEALGPGDGPVKRAILGENNARLYAFSPSQRSALGGDQVANWKTPYEKHGEGRTNLAYGYVLK